MNAARYLLPGLPAPVPEVDAVSAPYWYGLRDGVLRVQRCAHCGMWQFGPEWICHGCNSFDPMWVEVPAVARIYSWERVWHAAHPALKEQGPYLAVLVELPHAGNVRMVGNLLGNPLQEVRIGAEVEGVFEHHADHTPPYSLLHWRCL